MYFSYVYSRPALLREIIDACHLPLLFRDASSGRFFTGKIPVMKS
jgi:hypothetical protein